MAEHSFESSVIAIIRALVAHSPLILVEFIGLVFALIHWKRSSGYARLALPGFALLLFSSLIVGSCWAVLPQWLVNQGWDGNRLETLFTVIGFSTSTLEAVGIACLAAALYFGRTPAQ